MGSLQKWKIYNLISITIFHIISLYSLIEIFTNSKNLNCCIYNVLWIFCVGNLAGFGVTAGVHRLWCHRSYKAVLPFRVFIALCYSIAGQNTIYDWVRDHRIHHAYSDSDSDPHNASRGFWFSHLGWLMMTKHPKVLEKGRLVNMKDVLSDPVVIWHTKYFTILKILSCFLLPTLVPIFVWHESVKISVMSQVFVRYCMSLNFTWLVNSAAHLYGYKPFNKNIFPSENKLVSLVAIGEGWHNYHHVFPYDYKASELPNYSLNITTMILDFAAKCGWVYDLKQPTRKAVEYFVKNRGDGTYK